MEILHDLMEKNREQDKLAEVLVEDYAQKEEEYKIEGKYNLTIFFVIVNLLSQKHESV